MAVNAEAIAAARLELRRMALEDRVRAMALTPQEWQEMGREALAMPEVASAMERMELALSKGNQREIGRIDLEIRSALYDRLEQALDAREAAASDGPKGDANA